MAHHVGLSSQPGLGLLCLLFPGARPAATNPPGWQEGLGAGRSVQTDVSGTDIQRLPTDIHCLPSDAACRPILIRRRTHWQAVAHGCHDHEEGGPTQPPEEGA